MFASAQEPSTHSKTSGTPSSRRTEEGESQPGHEHQCHRDRRGERAKNTH